MVLLKRLSNLDSNLKISNLNLKNLITDVFKNYKKVRFNAHGQSMSPFIKDGDIVTLKPYSAHDLIKPGDIAAVHRGNKKIIVHRITRIDGEKILLKGDNCIEFDGHFIKENIMGIVTNIERNGKKLPSSRITNLIIACLSGSGLLTSHILPFLRHMKSKKRVSARHV